MAIKIGGLRIYMETKIDLRVHNDIIAEKRHGNVLRAIAHSGRVGQGEWATRYGGYAMEDARELQREGDVPHLVFEINDLLDFPIRKRVRPVGLLNGICRAKILQGR